jgi:tetratricopeptide (TPR) repeat protein
LILFVAGASTQTMKAVSTARSGRGGNPSQKRNNSASVRRSSKAPSADATLAQRAEALIRRGRLKEARTAYEHLLKKERTNIGAMLALARLDRRLGDDTAACRWLRKANSVDPEHLQAMTDLAGALRELDRAEEAADLYRKALAADPNHPQAHMGLGWIARTAQDEVGALPHFSAAGQRLRQAAAANPTNPGVLMQLATALRELGHFEESSRIFRDILAQIPEHVGALTGLGWIARKTGDEEGALKYFESAARINPSDVLPLFTLGRVLTMMQRFEEAGAVYRRVVQRAPRHAQALAALGTIAAMRHKWPDALRRFNAAAKADPGNIPVRLRLGEAFCQLGRYKEAERVYRGILKEFPRDIDARIGLGDTAKARGDLDAALRLYEEAEAAAPLDIRPKQEIRRLKIARGGYDWRMELQDCIAAVRSPDASVRSQVLAAGVLVKYGLTDVARPVLQKLEVSSPEARKLLLAVRQIERMGLAQPHSDSPDLLSAENHLDAIKGFIEMPAPGADTLLIVFGGANSRVSITFSLLHRILRKTGASVVYCRDLHQEWYAWGIVGLGDDFESTAEGFRKIAAKYKAKRVLTLGHCLGVQAAIRYGLTLGAEAVLGVRPRFQSRTLKPDERTHLATLQERVPPSHKKINLQFLHADRRPDVYLFFGDHYADDPSGLHLMQGLPGVRITPVPDSGDPMKDLLVRGLLEPMLVEFIAKGAVSRKLRSRIASSADPQYTRVE